MSNNNSNSLDKKNTNQTDKTPPGSSQHGNINLSTYLILKYI